MAKAAINFKGLSLLVIIVGLVTSFGSYFANMASKAKPEKEIVAVKLNDDDTTFVRLNYQTHELKTDVFELKQSVKEMRSDIIDIRIYMGKIDGHLQTAEARRDSGFSLFCSKTKRQECGAFVRRE